MSNGGGEDFATIARQAIDSLLRNVLNSRVVPILFHRSPGNDAGGDRAIAGIAWQVRAQGFVIQNGVTGADGRIAMTVRGASSTLELLHNGAVVARYLVRASTGALAGVGTVTGQQQRLRLLGYQVGHAGADGNGVDGNQRLEYERSLLDFQVDESLYDDAVVNAGTQAQLTARAGA